MIKVSRLIVIVVAITVAGCKAADILVTSDIGEKIIIKSSSVTVTVYDNEKSARRMEEFNANAMVRYNNCVQLTTVGREGCWNIHSTGMYSENSILDTWNMPPMKEIQYRTIFIDVNGDKTASDYKTVVCLPGDSIENRKRWHSLIKLGTDFSASNTIMDISKRELCDKFGKS
jgi:hypothetical protein